MIFKVTLFVNILNCKVTKCESVMLNYYSTAFPQRLSVNCNWLMLTWNFAIKDSFNSGLVLVAYYILNEGNILLIRVLIWTSLKFPAILCHDSDGRFLK